MAKRARQPIPVSWDGAAGVDAASLRGALALNSLASVAALGLALGVALERTFVDAQAGLGEPDTGADTPDSALGGVGGFFLKKLNMGSFLGRLRSSQDSNDTGLMGIHAKSSRFWVSPLIRTKPPSTWHSLRNG